MMMGFLAGTVDSDFSKALAGNSKPKEPNTTLNMKEKTA